MATEKRLIDANKLYSEIEDEYDLYYGEIVTNPRRFAEMVEDAPTVDAVEVVHGRWISYLDGDSIMPEHIIGAVNVVTGAGEPDGPTAPTAVQRWMVMGMDNAEAIKRIKDHIRVHHIGEYPHIKIGEALNMAMSALANDNNVGHKVEVVRCKDSKHCEHGCKCRLPLGAGLYDNEYILVEADDFCSYGERKDNAVQDQGT